MTTSSSAWSMRTTDFVDVDDAARDALIDELRTDILQMSAQIWKWFEQVYSAEYCSGEFKLLRMFDVRRSNEFEANAAEFWNDFACNKGPDIETKVMEIYETLDQFRSCPHLRNLMRNWGNTGKLCNMHTERILKDVKQATPVKHPIVERFLAAGCLKQFITRHVCSFGGDDPRVITTKRLVAAGAPLHANRAAKKKSKHQGATLQHKVPSDRNQLNNSAAAQNK